MGAEGVSLMLQMRLQKVKIKVMVTYLDVSRIRI